MRDIKGFNEEQQQYIAETIDRWYLFWKSHIANYEDGTHRLGHAKEQLKLWLCLPKELRIEKEKE